MTPGQLASSQTVAVVVCAYTMDRWDDVCAAYESLIGQDRPADEIVLVIDHNRELLNRLREFYPLARIIENIGAQGLSGARNTGVAATTSDIVLFLDDDARAESQWLTKLTDCFADASVLGVAGWAEPAWAEPGRPAWFPAEFLWVVGCSYRGLPQQRADIRNPIGSTMGFRRAALEITDGFSSAVGRVGSHPVGCEETELSIRLRQANRAARIVLEPEAIVHHRVSGARLSWRYFLSRCYWEGVSKAVVARAVGSSDALESERDYTTKVLPRAVLRGLRDAVGGDLNGLRRGAAVIVGLAVTTAGFVRGRLSRPTVAPEVAQPSVRTEAA